MTDAELIEDLALKYLQAEERVYSEVFDKLFAEIKQLRKEKEIWRRVCEFERKRWDRFYNNMIVSPTSEFGSYLQAVKTLSEEDK